MRVSRRVFERLSGQKAPRSRAKIPQPKSDLNELFRLSYWSEANKWSYAYPLTPEYRFSETRRWRFDFAIVERRVAIEMVGLYSREDGSESRHRRVGGMSSDYEKHNAATAMGWRVLYATRAMIPAVAKLVVRMLQEPLGVI